jgi:hypothetical protein
MFEHISIHLGTKFYSCRFQSCKAKFHLRKKKLDHVLAAGHFSKKYKIHGVDI